MKQVVFLERYGCRGESYNGVNIDKYVDKNTLICRELKTGDILTPYDFTTGGSPKFVNGTYEKYAGGENYASIEIECEFEEKELDMEREVYDTYEGINSYVKDLKTLYDIINTRYLAGYKKKIRMNEFKIFDEKIYLDTCGNVGIQKDNDRGCYSMSCSIPHENDKCECCGKDWTIYNMLDVFIDGKGNLYHKQCYFLHVLNKEKKEFIEAFKQVYSITDLDIDAIKNQYSDYEGYAPWFIFHTPDGDIKIGWRKRVVNISWLDNYKHFTETFDSEGNITRGFGYLGTDNRYIHAWGYDKVTEYLKRAKDSIA